MQSNCMRNCQFPLAGLSVKPEYMWCSTVFVIHPVNNFIQDLNSCATEALLQLIQPNSLHIIQGVRGNVIIDMFGTILDVWI